MKETPTTFQRLIRERRIPVRTIPAFLLAGLLALSAAYGCASIDSAPLSDRPDAPAPIRSLVILPTAPQLAHNGSEVNISQLREDARVLDELYAEYFEGVDAVTILTEERQEALSHELTGSWLERARGISKNLGSDGVLVTVIERFFEREGTKYAVDSPASVAFSFQLLRTDSDRIVCAGQFAETQQPLMANIFAFPKAARRGFKWLTARELAHDGLWGKLDECEQLQHLRSAP
jgi:hypothetical protein